MGAVIPRPTGDQGEPVIAGLVQIRRILGALAVGCLGLRFDGYFINQVGIAHSSLIDIDGFAGSQLPEITEDRTINIAVTADDNIALAAWHSTIFVPAGGIEYIIPFAHHGAVRLFNLSPAAGEDIGG